MSGRQDAKGGRRSGHRDTKPAPVTRATLLAAVGSLRALAASAVRVLRQVVGAPDYERYLQHHARAHAGTPPLPRREYYAEFVSSRFGSGASRCC